MKKLFALLAVVLAVVSCQKDADLGVNVGGEQLVNITVALPEATRASSGTGFDLTTLGTDFELRYILEIYVEDTNTVNDQQRIRKEAYTTATKDVVFPVRLVAGQNRNYRIVAWADIVPADANRTEGGDYDYYYETSEGLDQILINEAKWTAMKEQRDAYTAFKVVNNFSANSVINLTLKRPFAKVRVVSTDIKNFEDLGYKLSEGSVNYTVELNRQYNALYGTASNAAAKAHTFAYPTPYSESGDAYETKTQRTLFADYIFVDNIEEQDAIRFNLDIKDQFGANLNTIPFNTDIALYANTLTTIIGEVLTEGGKVEVDVNGDFNKPDYTYEVVDVETPEQLQEALENTEVGEIILQKDITLDGSLTFGAPATTASTFATRANTDLPGRNITIDGNGKTLKVVKVGTGRVIDFTKETNGASLTLKNLTIENNVSWIERIVNYNTNGTLTLENVKIINAEGCKLNYAINLPGFSDNAKVVIKDSEIWANANALNLWGENTVANISRSKLYVVDSNNIEGYSVVALNNGGENAAHNSIINVEGGEIKVMYEGDGETKPSSALRDATVGSTINISNETVVVGDIIYPVAILTYTNTTDFYSFSTLQAAIDKAKGDANVDAIRLIKDIKVANNKTQNNGYGAVGAQQLYGGIIDGNGKSFSVDAWGTWDSAINTTGGTIKNLNVTGGMRGIFINHTSDYSEKVVLENVTINGTVYTISCDQGTNKGLEATNCTFNGWTSYAATLGATKFVGCSFGKGQGYAFCRPYAATEFINCNFAAGYEIDAVANVTFENCTFGGVALTSANLADLVRYNTANATVK